MDDHTKTLNVQRMTALNAVMLTGCTLVGIFSNIFGHLFSSKTSVFIALLAWLIAIGLALYFSGKSALGKQASGIFSSLRQGLRTARSDKVFSIILFVLSIGAIYSAYSANKAVNLQQLHDVGLQTQENTSRIIQKLEQTVPPAEALTKLGYSMSQADICRAISEGHKEAILLVSQLSKQPIKLSKAEGEGQYSFCLEELLTSGSAHAAMLNKSEGLVFDTNDLSRLYAAEGIGADSPGKIDIKVIAKQAGTSGHSAQLLEVHATPMMFAVWGANSAAVKALISQSADVNAASRLITVTKSNASPMPALYDILITPLAEAKRLQLTEITDALTQAGAKTSSQAKAKTL
ncbi:hypothetical protein CTTA_4827 [Comamonas testosteroni]|uniref:Uncharacterized protein n=1 Tax=Comamonas testosteroni TaxID=285 RepID=A0A5A7MJG3_COMTE|nr:hypothetical protein [Comamonas testosteroni]GEQ77822.1 hypothetical protein CTTA_4827 [Comamonas testosteroni]